MPQTRPEALIPVAVVEPPEGMIDLAGNRIDGKDDASLSIRSTGGGAGIIDGEAETGMLAPGGRRDRTSPRFPTENARNTPSEPFSAVPTICRSR